MKVNTEITPQTLDNYDLFKNDFYDTFSLNPFTLQLDEKTSKSKTCFRGTYSMNKYMNRLFKQDKSETSYLWLGDTPMGNMIRKLDLDDHPFQFRYAENVKSCFDLPDKTQEAFMDKHFS